MFPERIETERLRLVRLCRENVPVHELYEHMREDAPHVDEISRYTMWEPHATRKETHDHLEEREGEWADRDRATYAIRLRDDPDELVGATNVKFAWERRTGGLGIWLRKPYWGRGYSGERAAALLDLAFETLDLAVVGAAHQDGNERSKRAIEKYVEAHGGGYDGILRNWIPKDGEVRDLHRYTVTREQYGR